MPGLDSWLQSPADVCLEGHGDASSDWAAAPDMGNLDFSGS